MNRSARAKRIVIVVGAGVRAANDSFVVKSSFKQTSTRATNTAATRSLLRWHVDVSTQLPLRWFSCPKPWCPSYLSCPVCPCLQRILDEQTRPTLLPARYIPSIDAGLSFIETHRWNHFSVLIFRISHNAYRLSPCTVACNPSPTLSLL